MVKGGRLNKYVKHTLLGYSNLLYLLFLNTCTDRTGQPIWTLNGLKDAVWLKEVPFKGGITILNYVKGSNIAKTPVIFGPHGNIQPTEKQIKF